MKTSNPVMEVLGTLGVVALVTGCLCLYFHLIRPPALDKTLDRLLEQASGQSKYWTKRGVRHQISVHNVDNPHYDHKLKIYAIREIGEMGTEASPAVNQLVKLCTQQCGNKEFDANSSFYLDIGRTLALIGDTSAVDSIIKWLGDNAITAGFDELAGGHCGPLDVVEGLTWFPAEHHEMIKTKLVSLLADLEKTPKSSLLAKRALQDGIKILQLDAASKSTHFDRLKEEYDLNCSRKYSIERG